jgi:hypothetical protein
VDKLEGVEIEDWLDGVTADTVDGLEGVEAD